MTVRKCSCDSRNLTIFLNYTMLSLFTFTYVYLQLCFRPKYAVAAVKKKLYSQNPHQAMFALLTLESIVKNCGKLFHVYISGFCIPC